MKIFLIVFLIFISFFKFIDSASAHSVGQPPYFKVNGIFTDYYPIPSTSLNDFDLPQDLATGTFLINQPIEFEIDINALPIPAEIVDKTKFLWEFGDGAKAEGLKNNHTYNRPGTYFVKVHVDSGDGMQPQILQTTAINILPSADYKLPTAVIEVNGTQSKDPLLDIININFDSQQKFNALKSNAGSSEITEYFWDFGDGNSSQETQPAYKYPQKLYAVFPLLRVKTKDGFIADSFVQLTDKDSNLSTKSQNFISNFLDWKIVLLSALTSLVLTALIFWAFKKFTAKR